MFAGYEVSILPEAVADKCDQPERANNNYCPGYIVAGAFLDIAAVFLKPYSDVLTALSGIAVAAFTFTLWLTTRQMWRASENQVSVARAANDLNRQNFITSARPWLSIAAVEIVMMRVVRVTTDRCWVWIEMAVVVKNSGASPALFVSFAQDMSPSHQLTGIDRDRVREIARRAVSAGAGVSVAPNGEYRHRLTQNSRDRSGLVGGLSCTVPRQ